MKNIESIYNDLLISYQAVYNVTCYNGPVRLKTAVELLNATKEIEMQVNKVGFILRFSELFVM